MILKIVISSLLALTAVNAVSANMHIYKDKTGQVLLTNTNSDRNHDKFSKKVTTFRDKNGSLVTTTSNYVNSAYAALDSSNHTTPENSVKKFVETTKSSKTSTANNMQYAFEVPDGYRLPTKADNFDDWKIFNAPNHLKADFNGDGIEDEAYILPKKGSKLGYGVFVSLNKANAGIQSGRRFQMFKLIADDDMQPQSFAIELAEPSDEIWETACGKGYWECEVGEPAEIKVTNPTIMFCYIESACSMYLWDSKQLIFKEIHFSD